jgi:hypothetical protein
MNSIASFYQGELATINPTDVPTYRDRKLEHGI